MMAVILIAVGLSGCGVINTAAVKAGLAESPYYQLGDTW